MAILMVDIGSEQAHGAVFRPGEKSVYGTGMEAQAVHHEIGDFDCEASAAFALLQHYYGSALRFKELKAILHAAIGYLKFRHSINLPDLSRSAKRSFKLMVKYIEANSYYISPVIPRLVLCDEQRKTIPIVDALIQPSLGM
jgi:hypothetical protein